MVPWKEGYAHNITTTEKKMEEQKPFGLPSSWGLFFIPILLGPISNKNISGIFVKSDLFLPQITEPEIYHHIEQSS